MTILDILKYPDPELKKKAAPVQEFDAKLKKLLDNMVETMYEADGIGLAAPQVGVLQRITVIDVSEDRDSPIHVVNPVITAKSGEVPSEEGCLSIPEFRETISRHSNVTVQAFNAKGEPFEIVADGILAICLQHEIDHLDGVLFIDHLSRLKREMFRGWYKKRLERE